MNAFTERGGFHFHSHVLKCQRAAGVLTIRDVAAEYAGDIHALEVLLSLRHTRRQLA